MTGIDIDRLRDWIGRTETQSDTVTQGLVDRFRATLGKFAADAGDAAPPAIHWCLAPPAAPPDMLGEDGHPARGGFLPPVPLPRRMWAGGKLEFHNSLRPGDHVTRHSTIADVLAKTGRTGALVFVTVRHEISTKRGLAITERQDIVYRPGPRMDALAPAAHAERETPRPADHSESIDATSLLLFRYSALTFNGHRIHYDHEYARDVEGYPGLVVHGPLQATLLLNFAARRAEGRLPSQFEYRGQSSLFAGRRFTLNAARSGSTTELWTADATTKTAMSATATNPSQETPRS